MTVAQLKKKLDKFQDTAEVIVSNDYMFDEGMYKATSVEEYDGFVLIDSDHKWFRTSPFYHKKHTPFNMAIEALKQEPCDDAISRKDAIDCVSAVSMCDPIIAQTKLKRLPNVFVKPKTGHWTEWPMEPMNYSNYICSVCGEGQTYGKSKYCLHCGAKMEVEE